MKQSNKTLASAAAVNQTKEYYLFLVSLKVSVHQFCCCSSVFTHRSCFMFLLESTTSDTARAPINIYEYIIFNVPLLEGSHASIFIHTSIVIALLVGPTNCCHVSFLQTMNTLNVFVSHEIRQHFYCTVISSIELS